MSLLFEVAKHTLERSSAKIAEQEIKTLKMLLELLPKLKNSSELHSLIASQMNFKPITESAHFTGYCQPLLKGSLVKSETARYPIYAASQTTKERKDIDCSGALENQGLEIAWVEDPLQLFFMHVQGSGIIILPDGSQKHLTYAGDNGLPYSSIGNHLIEKGLLKKENISAQKVLRFLKENPKINQEIMNINQRYIFFKVSDQGPIGTLGTKLTPMHSIACDWNHIPAGALCYLELSLPTFDAQGNLNGESPSALFCINQDTGSAIRGTDRIDIYCGAGDDAWNLAGHLNQKGRSSIVQCCG